MECKYSGIKGSQAGTALTLYLIRVECKWEYAVELDRNYTRLYI